MEDSISYCKAKYTLRKLHFTFRILVSFASAILVASAAMPLGPRAAAGLSFGTPQDAAPPTVQLSTTTLFDSGEHPSAAVSVLGNLSRAVFLSEARIVLLDGRTLLFIDPRTGELWTAGGEGGGPGEFAGTGSELAVFREGQDQLTVWDVNNDFRLTFFSDSGDVLGTRRVSLSPLDFHHPIAITRVWGMFPDRSLAVLDGGPPINGGGRDLGRLPGYVVEVSPEGDLRTIVEYQGHETGDKLFAHDTYVQIQGERIVVADTESEHFEILDRSGAIVSRIPMPGERVRVSEEILKTARADAHARSIRSHERGLEMYAERGFPTEGIEYRERKYSHNEVAPPINAVRFDRDGRLWVRHYALSGDEVERWTVWDGKRESFSVELPAGETWMDARGNHVLIRIRNSLGVDRVVMREMVLR